MVRGIISENYQQLRFGVFREGVFQKMPALEGQLLKEISVRFAGENHLRTQKNTKQSSAQRFLNDPFPKTPFFSCWKLQLQLQIKKWFSNYKNVRYGTPARGKRAPSFPQSLVPKAPKGSGHQIFHYTLVILYYTPIALHKKWFLN